MARTTLFCCDTYVAGQRGKLAIGEHKGMKTRDEAVRRAEHMAEKAPDLGALAYSIEADPDFEDYSEPKVLARFGRTPGGVRPSTVTRVALARDPRRAGGWATVTEVRDDLAGRRAGPRMVAMAEARARS